MTILVNTELRTLAMSLAAAKRPEDLFGPLPGSPADQFEAAHATFRQLAKVAHADRYMDGADKATAHEAFTRLNALWTEARSRIYTKTYGTAAPTAPKTAPAPALVKTKARIYSDLTPFAAGDLASVYRGRCLDAEVLLKVGRNPGVTDLLDTEAKTLTALHKACVGKQNRYLPDLLESSDVLLDTQRRRVNVFAWAEGYVSLATIREAYPKGLDPRHFVWIFNRLLTVLDVAHRAGYVHGAVLPEHVLVHPTDHSLLLIDWCFSVRAGERLKARPNKYAAWYPFEVSNKQAVTPATDLYMAAMCLERLLVVPDGDYPVPPRFTRLLEACLILSPARRVQDAWDLYNRLQEASAAVYGKRTYVPLHLP